MMILTPKEKAKELFDKFYQPIFDIDLGIYVIKDKKRYEAVKECAILAVDEIIDALDFNQWQNAKQIDYWKEVKQEIEKL